MSVPVAKTKLLIPPRRSDWVLRPRLLKLLDKGAKRRLTVVSAPAGFGKTTLVTSWLHGLASKNGRETRIAWLSLESDDNDLIRFLSCLIAALQTIDPGIGQTVISYFGAPRVPGLDHLMRLLINDLSALPGKNVLVLDDYHLIRNQELQSAVALFLELLPSQVHVVISTREEPMLSLPKLRAGREVTEIRLQDLRFTREETVAFLKRTMGLALSSDSARLLEDRTEGWVAGLQMAALSLRGRIDRSGSDPISVLVDALGGGQRDIIDYLASEVLRQQPAEVRSFLQQTAILDRFNASLAEAVTGIEDGQSMLAQIERANLFLIPLDDRRNWYRYHHLFADFLRAELTPAEQTSLHSRASHWHEEHDSTSEAIKHALAARDYVAAVGLIRRGAQEANRDGQFGTMLGWVNALPEEVVRSHIDLLVHKGWTLFLRGEIVTGEAYAALAVQNQGPDDPPFLRGMLLAFRAFLALQRGDPARAIGFAEEAIEQLKGTESYYRASALSYLGQAQRLVGERDKAIETLREAICVSQQINNHISRLAALGYLVVLLYQQGQLREALHLCEEAAREYSDSRGRPLPVAGLVHVTLGTLYYELNALERADEHLRTGISLCEQTWLAYPALLGHLTKARLHRVRGEMDATWETLVVAKRLARATENPRYERLALAVTAELQLREGLVAKAAATLAELPPKAKARSKHENLVYARLLLGQKRPDAALELLKELEESARDEGRLGNLISVNLLQAMAHRAAGHFDSAIGTLKQAVDLAAPEGYQRVFLDERDAIESLLNQIDDSGSAFLSSLLASFSAVSHEDSESRPVSSSRMAMVEPLTRTQVSIIRLVAEGLSNRDIASRLSITAGTAKWHLSQIYSKLNVSSRTQALAQAKRAGLI